MLAGRAAKLKRRAQLTARGVCDTSLKEELTASFGLPGVPFFVGVSADLPRRWSRPVARRA